jgi:hypothetical protein
MYDLCMFIRYLVSITQVRKDTKFGLNNWCECGKKDFSDITKILFDIILFRATFRVSKNHTRVHGLIPQRRVRANL